MFKIPKQEYTAEFKELAVKRVKDGRGIGKKNRDIRHFGRKQATLS